MCIYTYVYDAVCMLYIYVYILSSYLILLVSIFPEYSQTTPNP